jgi:hypothetical protein
LVSCCRGFGKQKTAGLQRLSTLNEPFWIGVVLPGSFIAPSGAGEGKMKTRHAGHRFGSTRLWLALVVFAATGALALAANSNFKILKPGTERPANAVVLFDGTHTSRWTVFNSKEPANWPVQDGAMVSTKNDIATKEKFKDFQLHVEFNEPMLGPEFKGQDRGNSGVYLQGRYELQVLDSFHNDTYANGACGAIYGISAPLKNAAKPPGEWQTYDITFQMARFENGKKVKDARVTVYWNGQLVQDNTDITKSTGGGAKETAEGGPIRLQFHHHSVKFRNIWIVPMTPTVAG